MSKPSDSFQEFVVNLKNRNNAKYSDVIKVVDEEMEKMKCKHCGGDILKPGNRSSYCTIECRNAAAAKRARDKRKSAVKIMKMTKCFKCKEEFEYRVWSSHLPPHFCPKCNRMRFGWGKS